MRSFKVWMSVLSCVVALAMAGNAQAAVNAGVLFLRIAAGARAAAMGETFVAVANDASATHWNPAGLGEYPLNNQWEEIRLPDYGSVLDAAVVGNGMPYDNFAAYDLWILTDRGLVVMSPTLDEDENSGATHGSGTEILTGRIANSVEISTLGSSSLAAAIRRYAPFISESEADRIGQQTAAAYLGISLDELEPLLARVNAAIPENYRDRTLVENAVREFRLAYREGRLNPDQLPKLHEALSALPEGGAADSEALDRARFTLDASVGRRLPASISMPLHTLFPSQIRAIASDGKILLVASQDRLLKLESNRWDIVDPPDGAEWAAEGINCLAVTSGKRLWVGTDNGVLTRTGGAWTRLGVAEGLPSPRVTHMAMRGMRNSWVMTDAGLARLNDGVFSSTVELTANVGDSVIAMLARFTDSDDYAVLAGARDRVLEINGFSAGQEPAPGTTLRVPYQLGVRGHVTAIGYDSYNRLWVGTEYGTSRYWRDSWRVYGYTKVLTAEATNAAALAESRLGERGTPERVANLAQLIVGYNQLPEDGRIEAGRTLYVYRNPAASAVRDFGTAGDRFLIATAAGQLEVKGGEWSRYYHGSLERDDVRAIVSQGGDAWFVTNDRIIIYKRSRREMTFMHSPWLPEFNLDLYYDYLSYVTHVDGWGTLGAAVTFFSYGEIIRTDEFGKLGNSFHSFDGAFSLSYGTRLSPRLAAGLTAKVIYSRLADQGAGVEIGSGSATAFALDAGVLYQTPWDRLTLGAALTNVGPDISYIDAQQSDPLPRNLAVGFAYRLFDSPYNKLTFVGEMNKELVDLSSNTSELKQIIYNVGAEYWYGSMIALRGGYIYDEDGDIKTPTLGAGLSFRQLQVDVAYIPSTRDTPLANTQRWSLTGRF